MVVRVYRGLLNFRARLKSLASHAEVITVATGRHLQVDSLEVCSFHTALIGFL